MKQNIKNAKKWFKVHKKEILVVTITVIAGGVSIKLLKDAYKSVPKATELNIPGKPYVKLDLPEGLIGMVEEISAPDGEKRYKDLWVGTVKLPDLGKLGEELMKLDAYDENSCISGGVVGLLKNIECDEL